MNTDPKKDVIYVDIEDDITSVIEKVKKAEKPIVALVPPKRIGVLQSVVNLKLLQRAATSAKKRVVLITNDPALMGLAAANAIPVAKNLQSRPGLLSPSAIATEEEEVINGEDLPVGELEKTADGPLELTGFPVTNEPGALVSKTPLAATAAARAPKKGAGARIPNFDTFRKKLFIFGGLGALLIVFLVWAIFFAGKATIAIQAKTNIVNINKPLQLRTDAKLDAAQGVAPAVVKTIKHPASVDFTATGKKDVGERAKGTVEFSTEKISKLGTTIPAGTPLTASNGFTYVTEASVTMTISNYQGASTSVVAAGSGTKYNGATGSMSGSPADINAEMTGTSAGGTDKTITIVSQSDIDKAAENLSAEDSNKVKTELKKQFDQSIVTIEESFSVQPGDLTSAPALGAEATTAKLSTETTYQLVGIARSDLRAIYDTFSKTQIAAETNQKIYESGDETTKFTEFKQSDKGYAVRAQATAKVGPNIDANALAKQLVGKRSGEIQQQIETIQGVENVTVTFSPFWVTKAPSDVDKIKIKFVLEQ